MITKRGRRLQRYDLQLIMSGDIVKDSNSYLKSNGSIEDFVSFREMIASQLQGKLWLYDEIEPTSIAKALSDSSWVEAMQEEFLQFKLQQVWKLVDLPNGKRAIRTK
ncbi:hypothetical protein Tco_1461398 [Tanacetum coccineum]